MNRSRGSSYEMHIYRMISIRLYEGRTRCDTLTEAHIPNIADTSRGCTIEDSIGAQDIKELFNSFIHPSKLRTLPGRGKAYTASCGGVVAPSDFETDNH
jgi:hypothetical protein